MPRVKAYRRKDGTLVRAHVRLSALPKRPAERLYHTQMGRPYMSRPVSRRLTKAVRVDAALRARKARSPEQRTRYKTLLSAFNKSRRASRRRRSS